MADAIGFRLKLFLFLLAGVMLLGTFAFAYIEGLSLVDAFYFIVVTVATVGYGDIHPKSNLGKTLVIALIVMGVGTFLEVIAGITQVMLKKRDKQLRAEKLHVIVGLFFSEMGTRLLRRLAQADLDLDVREAGLSISPEWTGEQFLKEAKRLSGHPYRIDPHRVDLEAMQAFVFEKGDLLLRLLENPTLLEHESFTELLRSIFHFRDELLNREQLTILPEADRRHLAGDMERIYGQLVQHWLAHMGYLKSHYPYLFSLAVRTNPFDRSSTAVIQDG